MLKSVSENNRSQLLTAKDIWILHVTNPILYVTNTILYITNSILHVTNSIMHVTNTDLEADWEPLVTWHDRSAWPKTGLKSRDRRRLKLCDRERSVTHWETHVKDGSPREANVSRKTCGGLDTVNHSQFAPAWDIFTLYHGHVTRWRQSTTDLSISITSKKLKLIPASVAISKTKLVMESAW